MIFGMDTFTLVHVVLSLIGIATGLIVFLGFVADAEMPALTAIFLATTVLTSVTGFGFPFTKLLPSHIVGIISLAVLAIALFALYGRHLAGAWRWIYVVSASTALYLNVFVLIVQLFQKVQALQAVAPTQSEPPFIGAQGLNLVVFLGLGYLAVRRFRASNLSGSGGLRSA
ncbi:MAG: hypothetical protein QM780_06480 [Hyphomicrobium sp.]|uniref:hypothetical protein n=1 Tax=Hyphomicrobium sp. TaxID=82 RepID=UPI0039E22ADC